MGSIEFDLTPGDDGQFTQVTLPPDYQKYIDGPTQMHRDDFRFIRDLLAPYGIGDAGGDRSAEPRTFERNEFFSALFELQAYGESVRSGLDRGFSDDEPVYAGKLAERQRQFEEFERNQQSRPSAIRMSNLCYLFLHIPEVRSVYMQIQAEKMISAFPEFVTQLPFLPIAQMTERHEYFVAAQRLMDHTMLNVVNSYDPQEVDSLGWVIGYENKAYPPSQNRRSGVFARTGNATFINLLEQVVTEATEKGEGLRTKLRNEFVKPGGLTHKLMRTSLGNFANDIKPVMQRDGLDATRRLLTERTFTSGVCPATYKMPEVGGGTTEKSIAFEYASAIVGRMPRQLPARRLS